MNDLEAVATALDQASRVLVVMHMLPDGDTTGTALGLRHTLYDRGKTVTVVCQDPVAPRYHFLPGQEHVVGWKDIAGQTFDVAVTVDCGDDSRVGDPALLYQAAPTIVNIDHHRSNRRFGTLNWIAVDHSATGEMIVDLIRFWGMTVSPEAAMCLYTAISTDTGSFRQSNTQPGTFAAVGVLLASGFDLARVNEMLWERQSWSETQILGWALSHVQRSPSGRVAWLAVPRAVMNSFGATDDEVEGIVNHLRTINGVHVAILTKEITPAGPIKVSWRGRADTDVSLYAGQFGGGGHRYSAGAIVNGALDEVTKRVVAAAGGQE